MSEPVYHVPVLLQEVIDGLSIRPDGVYVDCTFGGGGHSLEILKHLNADGRMVVFDQDADARKNVPADDRIIFVPHNFRHLQRFCRLHKITQVDGILADLGVWHAIRDQSVVRTPRSARAGGVSRRRVGWRWCHARSARPTR